MTVNRITIRLDQDLRQQLHVFADGAHVSEAKIVRKAIEDYLKKQEKPRSCLDLANRLGITGSINTLPSDLSTNKEYFQGFGSL